MEKKEDKQKQSRLKKSLCKLDSNEDLNMPRGNLVKKDVWKATLNVTYTPSGSIYYNETQYSENSLKYDEDIIFFNPNYFQGYMFRKGYEMARGSLSSVVYNGQRKIIDEDFYQSVIVLWNNVVIKSECEQYKISDEQPGFPENELRLRHSIKIISNDKTSIESVIDKIDSDAKEYLRIQKEIEKLERKQYNYEYIQKSKPTQTNTK